MSARDTGRARRRRRGRRQVDVDHRSRSRPVRERLTTDRVMTAALHLVDTEGLDALTMRRLGQALDRDPMALYRYAANRAALLDGVAELVLSGLEIPTRAGDWREQLRSAAHDFRRLAPSHPNVVQPLRYLASRLYPTGPAPAGHVAPAGAGPGAARSQPVSRPPGRCTSTARSSACCYGHVLNELQEVVVDLEETDAVLRLALHRLPPARVPPRLRSVAPDLLAGYDGAAELDQALDLLLIGLHPAPSHDPDHDH